MRRFITRCPHSMNVCFSIARAAALICTKSELYLSRVDEMQDFGSQLAAKSAEDEDDDGLLFGDQV